MIRCAAILLSVIFSAGAAQPELPIEVYFAPGVSCTVAIVREIGKARQTIHLQAYSFTSRPIARALTEAERRGVKVIAILDGSNRTKNYSAADFLAHEGVETYIDSQHAIAHNKIIIIASSESLQHSNSTRPKLTPPVTFAARLSHRPPCARVHLCAFAIPPSEVVMR